MTEEIKMPISADELNDMIEGLDENLLEKNNPYNFLNFKDEEVRQRLLKMLELTLPVIDELQKRGYEVSAFLYKAYSKVKENQFQVTCKKELK